MAAVAAVAAGTPVQANFGRLHAPHQGPPSPRSTSVNPFPCTAQSPQRLFFAGDLGATRSLKAGVDLAWFAYGRAVVALVQVLMLQLFLSFPSSRLP